MLSVHKHYLLPANMSHLSARMHSPTSTSSSAAVGSYARISSPEVSKQPLNNRGRFSVTHLLPAVCSTRWESGVALPTDCLVTVIFGSKRFERRFDDTPAQAEDQMERGFFLDVVVGQSTAVFELFAGEDQTLLIRGNTLFVLNLCLDIVDSI